MRVDSINHIVQGNAPIDWGRQTSTLPTKGYLIQTPWQTTNKQQKQPNGEVT